ncbi:carbonic anhydrase [Nocardia sp. NPDC004860]|uniref:carbonic anhydrase n=1 Tax=Nocardia sp. NPDC004860 TaxID=3154557 RepID=UPI0033B9C383
MDLSRYEFRTQPWFDASHFTGFGEVIPMKTLVIHCFDPRATEIPHAVAKHLPDEVYPGEDIHDQAGNKVGSTRTLFTLTNGGGRAIDALLAIATLDYLFQMKNVAVVHHSFCGASAFTAEQFTEWYKERHGTDLTKFYDQQDLAVSHFDESIKRDVELLRNSPVIPKHINLYGFFYEINSGELTEMVRDIPA